MEPVLTIASRHSGWQDVIAVAIWAAIIVFLLVLSWIPLRPELFWSRFVRLQSTYRRVTLVAHLPLVLIVLFGGLVLLELVTDRRDNGLRLGGVLTRELSGSSGSTQMLPEFFYTFWHHYGTEKAVLLLVPLVVLVLSLLLRSRITGRWRNAVGASCLHCGYDLRGSGGSTGVAPICPECGKS